MTQAETTVVGIRDPDGREANVYDLELYSGFTRVGLANTAIQQAAMAHGLSTLRVGPQDFTAYDAAGRSVAFSQSLCQDSTSVAGVFTGNKQLTREFLEAAGAAVPKGRSFRKEEQEAAVAYAEELGYPVVVKPLQGRGGAGVVAGIPDVEGLHWAIANLKDQPGRRRFIVEQHIPGQDYRIVVAYGQVLSVVLRRPASVVGDGTHTVAQLVETKNQARRQNPHTRTRLIRTGQTATHHLQAQGLSWDDVVPSGLTVVLAGAANVSLGGDSTEVLSETHPTILEAAVQAADAIPGLVQAGVDMLLPDHSAPLASQPGGICEINTKPALMANQAVMFGTPEPVADRLLQLAANEHALVLNSVRDEISVRVQAEGGPEPAPTRDWCAEHAQRLGLSGWAQTAGTGVEGVLAGPPSRVAALAAAFQSGHAAKRPEYVRTVPHTGEVPAGFEARHG